MAWLVAAVRPLHVAPVSSERVADDGRLAAYASQEMERIEFDRRAFLKATEVELDVRVGAAVRFGNSVEEIVLEALGADLIGLGWLRACSRRSSPSCSADPGCRCFSWRPADPGRRSPSPASSPPQRSPSIAR